MKKTIILLSLLLLAMTASAQFGGGNGSESNPFRISTTEHLQNMQGQSYAGVYFRLVTYIEAQGMPTLESFWGILDGQEHILDLNKPLIRNNYGNIKNLNVRINYDGAEAGNIQEEVFGSIVCNNYNTSNRGEIDGCFVYGNIKNTGTGKVGGIVGANYGGSISYCTAYVNIRSEGEDVGGIAGYSSVYSNWAVISYSYVHGTIIGKKNVGGIVGNAYIDTAIEACGSYVMVYGEENAGGIIGYGIGTFIGNSYAQGIAKGIRNIGGFGGYTRASALIYPTCYHAMLVDNRDVIGSAGIILGNAEQAVHMPAPAYMDLQINWNYINLNLMGNGAGLYGSEPQFLNTLDLMEVDLGSPYASSYPPEYPYHTYQSEYLQRKEGFIFFLTYNDADWKSRLVKWDCFGLEEYLDWGLLVLRGYVNNYRTCNVFDEIIVPCYAGRGTAADPYRISTPEQMDCMMDYLTENNGAGKHFRIMNDIDMLDFLATNYPATGWRGNEISAFDGNLHGGGHIISNMWMYHTELTKVGGLLAGTTENAVIDSLGISFSSRGMYALSQAGGLVGHNQGTINSCFTMNGLIVTLSDNAGTGGLAGVNEGTIDNAYTNCNIIAAMSSYAGGLVGYNTGIISHTYAAGVVTGGLNAGGLVGTNNSGRVRHNYYDKSRTLQQKGIGSDYPGTENYYVFGYSTEEMKNIIFLAELDFVNIWKLIPGYYPILQWQKNETAPLRLIVPSEFTEEIETNNTLFPFSEVKIYPNPTTGLVYIENKQENTEIIVYDLSGAVIIKTYESTIDMSSYPKGMYLVNINGKMEKIVKK